MREFTDKINFIFKNMCNSNIDELVKLFLPSDSPTKDDKRKRKVTIKKWLDGSISTPYKFSNDYSLYKISKIKLKDTRTLFPINAFEYWDMDKFLRQFKEYEVDSKDNKEDEFHKKYKYIYYFSIKYNKLLYFMLDYLENNKIRLTSEDYPQPIKYHGSFEIHSIIP